MKVKIFSCARLNAMSVIIRIDFIIHYENYINSFCFEKFFIKKPLRNIRWLVYQGHQMCSMSFYLGKYWRGFGRINFKSNFSCRSILVLLQNISRCIFPTLQWYVWKTLRYEWVICKKNDCEWFMWKLLNVSKTYYWIRKYLINW